MLDLLHDLREKRLWPIALILLIAIIAVPTVLMKSSEKPAAVSPPAAAPPSAQVSSAVGLEDPAQAPASDLDVFTTKNPFKPQGGKPKSAQQSAAAVAGSSSEAAGSLADAAPVGGGGAGSSGPTPTPDTSSPPPPTTTPDTKTTTPTGTHKRGGSNGNSKGDRRTGARLFTYAVKLRFGAANKVKTFKDVQRLDLVPSSANPIAAFLGVSASGNTAVFLIQAGFKVEGEGQCRPSIGRCSFLYLQTDPKHDTARLTAPDGASYGLRLTGIDQVDVKSAAKSTKAAAARAAKIRKARKHAHRRATPTQPRFLAPIFGDVGS